MTTLSDPPARDVFASRRSRAAAFILNSGIAPDQAAIAAAYAEARSWWEVLGSPGELARYFAHELETTDAGRRAEVVGSWQVNACRLIVDRYWPLICFTAVRIPAVDEFPVAPAVAAMALPGPPATDELVAAYVGIDPGSS